MSVELPAQLALYYAVGCSSVVAAAALAFFMVRRGLLRVRPETMRLAGIAALVFSLYLPVFQYLKYSSLHVFVDLSHWLQLLHSIVETGRPESLNSELAVPGTFNYFSAHFVPFIYLVALPFAIVPRAETLIVVNYLVMVSAAIPLYRLARSCNHPREVGWFLVLLLIGYPTFQYIVLYEFEMLRFSVPALLWMVYFWERRRRGAYWAALLLSTLVREEVGLTVAMFGVYVLLADTRKTEGALTIAAGVSAFWIISQVVMPALSGSREYEHVAAGIFSQFGRTPAEAIHGILTRPSVVLTTIAHPAKLANLVMMGLPLLFLPLLAPLVLVSTLANVGIGLLSSSIVHTSYMLYYLSPTIPFLCYAIVKGWNRVQHVSSAVMAATLCGLLTANVFFGPSPLSLQFWFRSVRPAPFRTQSFHRTVYAVTDHHRLAARLADQIPDGAVVSSQQFLHSRLVRKKGAMVFPQLQSMDGAVKADYVLLDTTNNGLARESPAYISMEQRQIVTSDPGRWRLLTTVDGYSLFTRAAE
jgi:uncharacterized membrane protein